MMNVRLIKIVLLACTLVFLSVATYAQHILPTPMKMELTNDQFTIKKRLIISCDQADQDVSLYISDHLSDYVKISEGSVSKANIVLSTENDLKNLGDEGYELEISNKKIKISANSNVGLFYGVQSLLQLFPAEIQAGKSFNLKGFKLPGIKVTDKPKYSWRSFMLDSGRQYQTPDFIKKYLDHMAMLKMNVFHWHLTEGQGWRIEIKKYPKLTEVGSQVAAGEEQQGYYTQEEIRDIVAYAKARHIMVVPEIDVPGHSEAALIAYPEYTCFKKAPESVMAFSSQLFCGGSENTYQFLEDVFTEVCDLFPAEYIHIGGDEAPKADWDKCPVCQKKIKEEGLKNSHDLQLYFTKRLANFLGKKGRKVICWGDVVYHDGTELPDNIVVCWWNWRGHKDQALKNAIKRGHEVICNTNYYTYLNFPLTPWSKYNVQRTFDLKTTYEHNPSDLKNPDPLVLGMSTCLWTDWNVKESMIDQRVFPRIYSIAEQMWNCGERLPFDDFYKRVQEKYPLLKLKGINYGPAMKEEIPEGYKWN